METAASFEARFAPRSYPTEEGQVGQRIKRNRTCDFLQVYALGQGLECGRKECVLVSETSIPEC